MIHVQNKINNTPFLATSPAANRSQSQENKVKEQEQDSFSKQKTDKKNIKTPAIVIIGGLAIVGLIFLIANFKKGESKGGEEISTQLAKKQKEASDKMSRIRNIEASIQRSQRNFEKNTRNFIKRVEKIQRENARMERERSRILARSEELDKKLNEFRRH